MPPEQEIVDAPVGVRASLEAGFAAAEAAAPAAAQISAPEPASPAPEAPAPDAQSAVNRDEAGRFAPKLDDTASAAPEAKPADQTQTPDQPAAAATEAQGEPIRPPAAWSAAAKSKFATLDPEVQAEIAKRERDMDKGLSERASALKRYEPLEQVIAPHRNRLAMAGVDDASYVRSLIAADEMLRGSNPVQAIAQIAQMYGVDLRQLGQPGQQPAQAAQPDPVVQSMASELATLKTELAQIKGAAQHADQAQTQAQIDTFAKDHPYFENVRPLMAALISSGQATDLASAYDMACRASPEVHPVILKSQQDAQAAAARAEATARANEAKQASGSVTGSPAPGAAPARSGPPPSVRESLEQQFSAALQ